MGVAAREGLFQQVSVPQKREVVSLIESWLIERESYQNKPAHPLVAVREGHLDEGGHVGGPKQTRPRGRSKPPIRDMTGINSRVDRAMSVVREVDRSWYDLLVYYATLGSLAKSADAANCSKPAARVRLDCGIACFKGAWTA